MMSATDHPHPQDQADETEDSYGPPPSPQAQAKSAWVSSPADDGSILTGTVQNLTNLTSSATEEPPSASGTTKHKPKRNNLSSFFWRSISGNRSTNVKGQNKDKSRASHLQSKKMNDHTMESKEDTPSSDTGLPSVISFEELRENIIGIDASYVTPFGNRLLTYADYTASGRALQFVEDYLEQHVLPRYANTHTEDVYTGMFMTKTLHEAETKIKQSVNAGKDGRIISCGTGSTGAINKLQQLVGVFIPPATRQLYEGYLKEFIGEPQFEAFSEFLAKNQPVVFVGPYEHHSNEISWRQGFASVIEVRLAEDGSIDLDHLEGLLKEEKYQNRLRIGSFSAASNVTGIRTETRKIAKLLHDHGAYACFDFAASAPYVEIDMSGVDGTHYDAVYISPHKFVGGPGSSGILVFNEKLYHKELGPTVAGGGTVQYVNAQDQDFIADTEEREKAGTPGALQTLRASLAMELKNSIGAEKIESRERKYLAMAFDKWLKNGNIEILGPRNVHSRISIVSFNIRDPSQKWLHPKFVAKLLNDLFGIQSRAGCSCSGPYGHLLLKIDACQSEKLRSHIKQGFHGLKLGWCRLGFHFAHDEHEAKFLIDAVLFVADFGHLFIPLYDFDVTTGSWTFKASSAATASFVSDEEQATRNRQQNPRFGIHEALQMMRQKPASPVPSRTRLTVDERVFMYKQYFDQAFSFAMALEQTASVMVPNKCAELTAAMEQAKISSCSAPNAYDPMAIAASWFRI